MKSINKTMMNLACATAMVLSCCSKVNLSGSNGNVNMSGWKDDNPDDERRETTRHHTTIVT